MPTDLASVLAELGADQLIDDASSATLASEIAKGEFAARGLEPTHKLVRFGYAYELEAVAAERGEGIATERTERAAGFFAKAYDCWAALLAPPFADGGDGETPGLRAIGEQLPMPTLDDKASLCIRLTAAGLGSDQSADLRLLLGMLDLRPAPAQAAWPRRVATTIATALSLLARKANGWEDVREGLSAINDLRDAQAEFEQNYLMEHQDAAPSEALKLLGLYHTAQVATLAGEYLTSGTPDLRSAQRNLDRHRAAAVEVLGQFPMESHFVELVHIAATRLVKNAIWSHLEGLNPKAIEYLRLLTNQARHDPILELWPGQQAALRSNLLDPYPRAALIEMPTSAGKTLLAKFRIVQALSLQPDASVAYVVPTRALVNQLTRDLRHDLAPLGFKVEQAVPAYELDPIENALLSDGVDVLVTTPEKLDFLIRRDHPATTHLSLVVADEAHGLADGSRGARLELLLAMIQRERPASRFLLLSPFLPNDHELLTWLAQDRALPPIRVSWSPSRRVVGVVDASGRGQRRRTFIETVESTTGQDIQAGLKIPLAAPAKRTMSALSATAAEAAAADGTVLVLCRGRGTAATRAEEIALLREEVPPSELRAAVERYVAAELGSDCDLLQLLPRGVAYHHSGLPQETRWLVESLIRNRDVDVVTGTTTLAQGVNFPIRTVIIETLQKGTAPLTYSDFWNIAGRAGRAMLDRIGVVLYPTGSPQRRADFIAFLQGEASEITSQLAGIIARADELQAGIGLREIRESPELSSFLQFLAHAMRVSGEVLLADDVEDLLRSSLVYHQAETLGREFAERLVSLARTYIEGLSGQRDMLPLADKTGFATPSVGWLLASQGEYPTLRDSENWSPDILFGEDLVPLTERIELVGNVPEIRLSEAMGGHFSPERVARIVRDWVSGRPLGEMARDYGDPDLPSARALSEFSRYLFSSLVTQTSWGLGALELMSGGDMEGSADDREYVPSMVYFGVSTPEAVWMRMVGVPRFLADPLGREWREAGNGTPGSHQALRDWVGGLSDERLGEAIPVGALSAEDFRAIWSELSS